MLGGGSVMEYASTCRRPVNPWDRSPHWLFSQHGAQVLEESRGAPVRAAAAAAVETGSFQAVP